MTRVSAVVNTLNEETNLPGCLESLRWCDDIVVVDMHSEDRTAEVAAHFGCRVFQHERTGYVEPARNFALSQARHEWVLVVDADERVSPGLAAWIKDELSDTQASAFRIPRHNCYGEHWMKCCGWFPDEQLRLFRRDCTRYSDRIHRAPEIRGTVETLPVYGQAFLQHLCFDKLEARIAKVNQYATITGQTMAAEGRRVGAASLLLRTGWAFLAAYFLQGGWRAGTLGVVLAWERAFATFLKYAKLWELQQTSGTKS